MGIDDVVSEVFAKAETFTIVDYDVENESIRDIQIIDNEAKTFSHGAGPVAIKILLDHGVEAVVTHEIGVGSMKLLEEKGIRLYRVDSGVKVREALNIISSELRK